MLTTQNHKNMAKNLFAHFCFTNLNDGRSNSNHLRTSLEVMAEAPLQPLVCYECLEDDRLKPEQVSHNSVLTGLNENSVKKKPVFRTSLPEKYQAQVTFERGNRCMRIWPDFSCPSPK